MFQEDTNANVARTDGTGKRLSTFATVCEHHVPELETPCIKPIIVQQANHQVNMLPTELRVHDNTTIIIPATKK